MAAYYNEFDPYAAQWLQNLIGKGLIARGEVDERSIEEVEADDLKGFTQCHFFAGIGGWSLAARLAGWGDERPLWTGSAPCQPFSTAGNQKGQKDERHLWPKFFELICAAKPSTVMGEQVSAAIKFGWLDGVSTDLEGEGYTTGSIIIPACAVNAPHRRDRLWFAASRMGNTKYNGQLTAKVGRGDEEAIFHNEEKQNITLEFARASASRNVSSIPMANANGIVQSRQRELVQSVGSKAIGYGEADRAIYDSSRTFWEGAEYISGPDGKARRVESGICLLVDGLPARMAGRSTMSIIERRKGVLSGFGNAIVPQVASEIIKAFMECEP